jgi:Zn-finger nucleic acid-binding protein
MDLTCPKCQGKMRSYERSSVTVDQCTECRGIFLDRGELEKLIDAENTWHGRQAQPSYEQPQHRPQSYPQPYQSHQQYPQAPARRRRKSFLDELFD